MPDETKPAEKPTLAEQYEFDMDPAPAAPAEPAATLAVAESVAPPAPSPKPEPTVTSTGTGHPDFLRDQARDLGFSDGEMDSIPTATLAGIVRRQIAELKKGRAPEPQAAPTPAPAVDPVDEQFDKLAPELEPAMVGMLKSMRQQIADLKKDLADVKGFQKARVEESRAERIDRVFKERADLFGEMAVRDLAQGSGEHLRRLAVLRTAEQDTSHTSLEAKVKKAIDTLYPGKAPPPTAKPAPEPETPALQRISETDWNNAGLAKPTHRNGAKEPPGRDKAIASVEAQLREMEESTTVGGDGPNGHALLEDFPD